MPAASVGLGSQVGSPMPPAPMASAGNSGTPGTPGMSGGASGSPAAAGAAALQKQQPDEAMFIVKALSNRLKGLTPPQPKTTQPQQQSEGTMQTQGQPAPQAPVQVNGGELALQALQGAVM